jgi:hypothetical protein
VLLDPLEEQLDPPSGLEQLRNGQGRQKMIVGQKDEPFPGGGIAETYSAKGVGIIPARVISLPE